MALNTVTTGNTILAGDVNQLVNVLQRSAGQTESGQYYLVGNGYTTSANVSLYMRSLSQNATPSSVTVDTATQSSINFAGSVQTGILSANGVLIYFATTGASVNPKCGGNWTIQY